jgi:hypothetical protein
MISATFSTASHKAQEETGHPVSNNRALNNNRAHRAKVEARGTNAQMTEILSLGCQLPKSNVSSAATFAAEDSIRSSRVSYRDAVGSYKRALWDRGPAIIAGIFRRQCCAVWIRHRLTDHGGVDAHRRVHDTRDLIQIMAPISEPCHFAIGRQGTNSGA